MAKSGAKLIDLRPQKTLLDPTFEGYKLSLEQLPIYKHEIPATVEHLRPSEEQYSYQHLRTFGLHNHLIPDLWNPNLCYFISREHQIYEVHLSSLASQHPEFILVWEPSTKPDRSQGNFNAAVSFPSANLAVVTDGAGSLAILSTGERTSSTARPWQTLFSQEVLGGAKPFTVIHSYLANNADEPAHPLELHALLLRIESLGLVETERPLTELGCTEKDTPFITLVEWVTLSSKANGVWTLERVRRIAAPHGFEYASILNNGFALCIAAREPVGLIYDSQKGAADVMDVDNTVQEKPDYLWTENNEEVNIWFRLDDTAKKDDIQVNTTSTTLDVVYKGKVLLQGELQHVVSTELTTWFLSDGKLEIILGKVDKGAIWGQVVQGNTKGQLVPDADSAAEWHQRLVRMTSEEMAPETVGQRGTMFSNQQLEECDAFPGDELYLMRLDGESHVVTHKASLGSHQVLFTVGLAPNMAPALCLRHDVDGLVWQPLGDEHQPEWACTHVGTFQALGYVQASKEQRKFTVCPQDFTYAAICDAMRHVYLYRQPGPMPAGIQLTHRPTGRKVGSLAVQQLVSLDTAEETLGALATSRLLLLITSTTLFAVKVSND